jgi:tetratricopeptide (TPR) repeat protein
MYFSNQAIKYASKYNNYNDLAYGYIISGSIFLAKSDFNPAIEKFNKALQIAKKTKNDYQLHTIYNNLGVVYKYSQEYTLARSYYNKALEHAIKIDDNQGIGQSYSNIGNVYILSGMQKEGLEYYRMAELAFLKISKSSNDLASLYNNIGYVYYVDKKYSKSIIEYLNALTIFDSLKFNFGKAIIHNNIAEAEIALKNFKEALIHIEIADSLHKIIDSRDSRKNLYFTSYELFKESGQLEKAIEFLSKYHELKDSIYSLEFQEITKEIKTRYEVEKIKEENKLKDLIIKQQKRTNLLLFSIITTIIIIVLLLVSIIRNNRLINKTLRRTTENYYFTTSPD